MNHKTLMKHLPFIILFIGVALLIYHPFLDLSNSRHRADYRISHQNSVFIMDAALSEGKFPLWTERVDSGMPFFAIPDKPFFYPPLLLLLLFLGPVASMNILAIAHIIFSALGMYFLGNFLFKNRFAAALSALVWALSTPNVFRAPFWRYGVAWIPLITFFMFKIFTSKSKKELISFSILTAVALAMQVYSGGIFIFYYTFLFVFCIFLVYKFFISKKRFSMLLNLILIALIVLAVFFGLTAVRFLPNFDWSSQINRAQGLSVRESMGRILSPVEASTLFFSGQPDTGYDRIGFVVFLLVLLSFFHFSKTKDKKNLFFILVMILNILFVTGLFYETLYNLIPGLSQQRIVSRSLFVYVFAAAILAGYGFLFVINKLKKSSFFVNESKGRRRLNPNKFYLIFLAILVLICVDMFYLSTFTELYQDKFDLEDYKISLTNNNLVNYLVEKESIFRTHNYEVRGIDWTDIETATVPLGMQTTSQGFGGFWFNDYLHGFLSLAYMGDYAKTFGILNVKYVASSKPINVSGLVLEKVFDENKTIDPDFIDGPYLYNNTKALSRAFYPENKVFVVGETESAKNLVRAVLLRDAFNTSTSVVVRSNKEKISEFSYEFLSDFDIIILAPGSLDSSISYNLKKYVEGGGILIPNVLEGENAISQEGLRDAFILLNGSSINFDQALDYKQNKLIIKNPSEGWLVLSERYSLFPGWRAYADGNEIEVWQADGIISAVNVPPKTRDLEFVYRPVSFVKGLSLFFFTLIVLVFVYYWLFFKKSSKR